MRRLLRRLASGLRRLTGTERADFERALREALAASGPPRRAGALARTSPRPAGDTRRPAPFFHPSHDSHDEE